MNNNCNTHATSHKMSLLIIQILNNTTAGRPRLGTTSKDDNVLHYVKRNIILNLYGNV